MSVNTKIQWTNKTWNPWHGCLKVSPGCKFCYMYRDKEKYGQTPTVVSRSKTTFKDPLKWENPELVFTCSWSDWFIEAADEWRDEAWAIIKACPHLTFQILTKRPERILEHLPADWENGYPNVWLGVSGENADYTFERLQILLKIPAKTRWLSAEPLLNDIITPENLELIGQLDWVVVGGESGNENGKYRYRSCDIEWIEKVINNCQELGVPVFVKQMGTALRHDMRLLDQHGGNIKEWPDYLQIREYPSDKIHLRL